MNFPTDYGILERHTQVNSILGALDIEKESFRTAQFFSWIFFAIWIIFAILQAICFLFANGRYHPLSKILEGSDASGKGKFAMPRQVRALHIKIIIT